MPVDRHPETAESGESTALDLLLFAKPPVSGAVKTRLAATVGAESAARWASAFLADSLERLGRVASDVGSRLVLVGDASSRAEFYARATESLPWSEDWSYRSQGSGHLGVRMERAFAQSLDRGRAALALGADTPHLPEALLRRAVQALRRGEVVLGPSDDGGFYALGLPATFAGWSDPFRPTEWGSAEVLDRTRSLIEAWGRGILELRPFRDFDHEADLVQWAQERASGSEAPSDRDNPRRTIELARHFGLWGRSGAVPDSRGAGEAGSSRESS